MITAKDVRIIRAGMNLSRSEFGSLIGRTGRQVLTYETDGAPIPRIAELAFAALAKGITEFKP
jgi:DNA-binding transcriptional regulator YiaG